MAKYLIWVWCVLPNVLYLPPSIEMKSRGRDSFNTKSPWHVEECCECTLHSHTNTHTQLHIIHIFILSAISINTTTMHLNHITSSWIFIYIIILCVWTIDHHHRMHGHWCTNMNITPRTHINTHINFRYCVIFRLAYSRTCLRHCRQTNSPNRTRIK